VTPAGKPWTYRTLNDKLRDPRICGYRSRRIKEYNPETDRETRRFEIVRDEKGKPVIGQWEPIISVEQWQAVNRKVEHFASHAARMEAGPVCWIPFGLCVSPARPHHRQPTRNGRDETAVKGPQITTVPRFGDRLPTLRQ
jgi:hypothetical protein